MMNFNYIRYYNVNILIKIDIILLIIILLMSTNKDDTLTTNIEILNCSGEEYLKIYLLIVLILF